MILSLLLSAVRPAPALGVNFNHSHWSRFFLTSSPGSPEGSVLRYKRSVGGVITYKQVFYAERQVDLNRPEFFKFRIEWTVKVATIAE